MKNNGAENKSTEKNKCAEKTIDLIKNNREKTRSEKTFYNLCKVLFVNWINYIYFIWLFGYTLFAMLNEGCSFMIT